MENKKTNKGLIIGLVVGVIAIVAIILVIVLTLGNKAKSIIGTYDLVGMVSEGEEISKEDIELMKQYGLYVYIQVEDETNGVLTMFGEKLPFKYDGDNIIINNELCPYTYSKEELTIKKDTEELIFHKVDPSAIEERTNIPNIQE